MKNLVRVLAVLMCFSFGSAKAVEIVSFNAASSEAYVGAFVKGIKATAAQYGYDITVFENNYNQAEQNQQVEQYLSSGALPDVFIWWPPDAVAGLGSLRKLAKTGVPVLKINQLPNEQDKAFIFGYAGPDDSLRAYNAGEMMVKAMKMKQAAGGDGFNVIALSYPLLRWLWLINQCFQTSYCRN